MEKTSTPLRAIRENCVDCSGGSRKYVTYGPCDGVRSTRCSLWPYRFGRRPATIRQRYGDPLLDPNKMPPADIELDDLPQSLEAAATAAIDINGYTQPAVKLVVSARHFSAERRESLERARAAPRNAR